MTTSTMRKIVHINEEMCNGCGQCILSCAEGALQIIDGKARIVSEKYCDGLGACLGECPQGAINIEERIAEDFDKEAVTHHLAVEKKTENQYTCPSNIVSPIEEAGVEKEGKLPSMLSNWPVQLSLVTPSARFLQGADVVFTAHCVPFAYATFHKDFLKEHILLIACPKLDDFQAHLIKLTELFRKSDIKSLTIIHMEVPCCSGLIYMVKEALKQNTKRIPVQEITIKINGEIHN